MKYCEYFIIYDIFRIFFIVKTMSLSRYAIKTSLLVVRGGRMKGGGEGEKGGGRKSKEKTRFCFLAISIFTNLIIFCLKYYIRLKNNFANNCE